MACPGVILVFEQLARANKQLWLKSASRGPLLVRSVKLVEGEWRGDLVTPMLEFNNTNERFTLQHKPGRSQPLMHCWLRLEVLNTSGVVSELDLDPTAAQLRHNIGGRVVHYKHVHVWAGDEPGGALYTGGRVVSNADKIRQLVAFAVQDAAVVRKCDPDRRATVSYNT